MSVFVDELEGLSGDIDDDEAAEMVEEGKGPENAEGWVDELELLSREARVEHAESVLPVKLALAKVSISTN